MQFRELTRWQWSTLFTLTVGYAGYYFCRSNFAIATPLLLEEFAGQGINKETIGQIASLGIFFYAGGKLFNGILVDYLGGRRMFLFGMAASVCATILFGLGSGVVVFGIAWCINRIVQSMGWAALLKTASVWFPVQLMGTLTGILSMSYLFGDVLAKWFLGGLVTYGVGWRGIFFAAAAVLTVIAIISRFSLKGCPEEVGETSPEAHPDNLFGEAGNETRPGNLLTLLAPLLMSLSFWLVCCMNFGLTLIRETFNFWMPTYLHEVAGMEIGQAGAASALFPLFGGISVLFAGYISDKAAKGRRGAVMAGFLVPALVMMLVMANTESISTPWVALALMSAVGFLTLAPYSFLAGVICVDLGGKRATSTAAGIADTVGYGGAILSGFGGGFLAQHYGWQYVFYALAAVLTITVILSLAYWYVHEIHPARRPQPHAATPPPFDSNVEN